MKDEYINMLKTHEEFVERVQNLIGEMDFEYMSTRIDVRSIKGIIAKLLKERERLHLSIDDKYNLSQEVIDIIESDLQGLRERYDGAIKSLENILNLRDESICVEKQHTNDEKSRELPDKLNNDIAREYFSKAIELDLMDEKYNWKDSRGGLAYFVAKMSEKLDLLDRPTYNTIYKEYEKAVHWEPFEELFEIKKGTLRGYYSKYKNGTVDPPKAANKIDSIFE